MLMVNLGQSVLSKSYGQTPSLARADAPHVSEHQTTLCFVGQNAYVPDHGCHLAMCSLATCALNVT
jgi:hypothetical protein